MKIVILIFGLVISDLSLCLAKRKHHSRRTGKNHRTITNNECETCCDCPQEVENSICASNGKIYNNICLFECAKKYWEEKQAPIERRQNEECIVRMLLGPEYNIKPPNSTAKNQPNPSDAEVRLESKVAETTILPLTTIFSGPVAQRNLPDDENFEVIPATVIPSSETAQNNENNAQVNTSYVAEESNNPPSLDVSKKIKESDQNDTLTIRLPQEDLVNTTEQPVESPAKHDEEPTFRFLGQPEDFPTDLNNTQRRAGSRQNKNFPTLGSLLQQYQSAQTRGQFNQNPFMPMQNDYQNDDMYDMAVGPEKRFNSYSQLVPLKMLTNMQNQQWSMMNQGQGNQYEDVEPVRQKPQSRIQSTSQIKKSRASNQQSNSHRNMEAPPQKRMQPQTHTTKEPIKFQSYPRPEDIVIEKRIQTFEQEQEDDDPQGRVQETKINAAPQRQQENIAKRVQPQFTDDTITQPRIQPQSNLESVPAQKKIPGQFQDDMNQAKAPVQRPLNPQRNPSQDNVPQKRIQGGAFDDNPLPQNPVVQRIQQPLQQKQPQQPQQPQMQQQRNVPQKRIEGQYQEENPQKRIQEPKLQSNVPRKIDAVPQKRFDDTYDETNVGQKRYQEPRYQGGQQQPQQQQQPRKIDNAPQKRIEQDPYQEDYPTRYQQEGRVQNYQMQNQNQQVRKPPNNFPLKRTNTQYQDDMTDTYNPEGYQNVPQRKENYPQKRMEEPVFPEQRRRQELDTRQVKEQVSEIMPGRIQTIVKNQQQIPERRQNPDTEDYKPPQKEEVVLAPEQNPSRKSDVSPMDTQSEIRSSDDTQPVENPQPTPAGKNHGHHRRHRGSRRRNHPERQSNPVEPAKSETPA